MTGDAQWLYGTQAPPPPRRLSAGALTVDLAPGGAGAVRWGGREVLRAAQALVRDTDWGTWPEEGVEERVDTGPSSFRCRRSCRLAAGRLALQLDLTATAGPGAAQLRLDLRLTAREVVATNRAGFVVLHPAAVAGTALRVRHADGGETQGRFPELVAPAQPFREIAGLAWACGGVAADLSFLGEVFEMEDQRNWTDGSFKTYCRPLSRPWPYELRPGEAVEQSLILEISGAPETSAAAAADPALSIGPPVGLMPEMHLAADPAWGPLGAAPVPGLQGRRLRLDLRRPLPPLPRLGQDCDLELILPDGAAEAAPALAALAAAGHEPRRIAALPAAYLASHQPDGVWPAGLSPEEALPLTRQAFPRAEPMGGVLTYFTELNRYPRAGQLGDSVTFGTAAIVHDPGDLAVMQTLEALPAIFRSAGALAQGRPLRLGLVAIGMRSNPYGAGLQPNPDGLRRTMTDRDPRHRAAFGAAFALGAVAATEGSPVLSLCLGAEAGPFALDGPQGRTPLGALIAALAGEAGRPRRAVRAPAGIAAVASDRRLFLANLGPEPAPAGLAGAAPLAPYGLLVTEVPER